MKNQGYSMSFRQSAMLVALLTIVGNSTSNSLSAAEQAPETFKVKVETSKGDFTIEVTRKWAPNGADRFYELVKKEFYKDTRFFRVVPGFMVQWGINGDPSVQKLWREATFKDDPVVASNQRGYITYAKTGAPDSRSTQLFINFGDNSFLDKTGFAPFGRVIQGMEVVDKINSQYKERPNQGSIQSRGNEYLNSSFPDLDFIKSMKLME